MNDDTKLTKTRLNPFIFTSETSVRFIFLIISLISLYSLFISKIYYLSIDPFISYIYVNYHIPIGYPSMLLLISLIFLAFFLYFSEPAKTIKKNQLKRLEVRYPEVTTEVHKLSSAMEINTPIVLLLDERKNTKPSIYVFGTHNRAYIVFHDLMIKNFYNEPRSFEAIIFHELSHIKNNDYYMLKFAKNLTFSFLFFILLLSMLTFPKKLFELINFPSNISIMVPYYVSTFFIFFIFGLLIFYILISTLKVREFYADARAASIQKDKQKCNEFNI